MEIGVEFEQTICSEEVELFFEGVTFPVSTDPLPMEIGDELKETTSIAEGAIFVGD